MSLQWDSPAEAAVSDIVRHHIGITSTNWEYAQALDHNRRVSVRNADSEVFEQVYEIP
jgi:hypothetical protein